MFFPLCLNIHLNIECMSILTESYMFNTQHHLHLNFNKNTEEFISFLVISDEHLSKYIFFFWKTKY